MLQRIPHSDSEELKKYFAEAVKKVKEWLDVLQKQLGALGIESIEDYYNLPMVWVQKVCKKTTDAIEIQNFKFY